MKAKMITWPMAIWLFRKRWIRPTGNCKNRGSAANVKNSNRQKVWCSGELKADLARAHNLVKWLVRR